MTLRHPSIARLQIEGDREAGLALLPRARKAIALLQNRMELAGIEVAADSFPLGNDAYLIVRIGGGVNVARIVVGSATGRVLPPEQEEAGVTDFVSGFITDTTIGDGAAPDTGAPYEYLKGFVPTERTTLTHTGLAPLTEQGMERLGVRPFPEFGFPASNEFGTIQYSQYTHIKPTMYSGAMKRLVQALCGFGKLLPRRDLPAVQSNEPLSITRSASIYAEVFDRLSTDEAEDIEARQERYAREVAEDGLQVRYDHRFFRTHGLYQAQDDQWWLVEISKQRGVIAMRLPLDPLTVPVRDAQGDIAEWPFFDALQALEVTDEDGETRELVDEDGIAVLEAFGGFPTGQGFPSDDALLEAYIRAGEVIRLLAPEGLSDFYRHSMYSTAMGWAFNDKGNEAHNTGWRFDGDGIQSGVHHQVNIDIGEITPPAAEAGADAVAARARATSSLLDNGEQLRDLLARKAYRLTRSQIIGLELLPDEAFIRELDRIAVTPIASGSGSLRLIREGRLWCGHKKNAQPEQIKFYEPLLGYLLSHDFRPARDALRFTRVACDTTMHVFFDGGTFKWVRYFVADSETASTTVTTDDFDACSWIGRFTRTRESGARRVSEGFYTSDFDDRQELAGSKIVERFNREYLGPWTIGVSDDLADIRRNYAFRSHRFRHNYIIEQTSGEQMMIGVAVPENIREAYFIGTMRYRESYSRNSSWEYKTRGDPYLYEGWRCVVSTAGFAGWPSDMQECPPGCDSIRGVALNPGNPRVARYESYFPYKCSEYIDTGPWAEKCDNLDALVYNVPAPPLPPNESEITPRKADYIVRYVSGAEPRNKITVQDKLEDASYAISKFNIPSPDEFGFKQNIRAAFNALGDTDSAVWMRSIDGQVYGDEPSKERGVYGPYDQDFIQPSIVYIGVV